MSHFLEQLNEYIRTAFDNEQSFIERFLPKGVEHLTACYMASGTTFIRFQDKGLNEFEIAIDTNDFIEWYEKETA